MKNKLPLEADAKTYVIYLKRYIDLVVHGVSTRTKHSIGAVAFKLYASEDGVEYIKLAGSVCSKKNTPVNSESHVKASGRILSRRYCYTARLDGFTPQQLSSVLRCLNLAQPFNWWNSINWHDAVTKLAKCIEHITTSKPAAALLGRNVQAVMHDESNSVTASTQEAVSADALDANRLAYFGTCHVGSVDCVVVVDHEC